jgi:hypothetical protein
MSISFHIPEKNEEMAIATIKIIKDANGKIKKRIQEVFSASKHSVSYCADSIIVNGKKYVFNYPLMCLFEKEKKYYIINNEQFDIIGTGLTQDEAELNFNEEFDYLYTRLNSLDDSKLSKKLLRIKSDVNNFIKEVQ